jgi:hypothetical protein
MQLRERSAKDITERKLQKEQFYFLEFSKDPNYEDKFRVFIKDLRGKIEDFTADQYAARTALIKRRTEDDSKLTKEEINSYTRNAARQKKPKEPKEITKEKKQADWNLLCRSLIKAGLNEAQAKKQAITLYTAQGKEIPW